MSIFVQKSFPYIHTFIYSIDKRKITFMATEELCHIFK